MTSFKQLRPPYYSKMNSGQFSIILEEGVTYDNFPRIARKWVKKLSLKVIRKIDGPGERMWVCKREGYKYWLVHDDWFPEISLEPQNIKAGNYILKIGSELGIVETHI